MPRDGSNVFSPPAGTLATTLTTIESAPYNAFVLDLTALANEARPITAGGTGGTTASAARTNLGLAIGTNVQAQSAVLTDLSDNLTATGAELNLLDGVTGKTGADNVVVTGTAGTDGQYAVWNGDGDIVGQALPTADTATWEAGTDTTEAIVSPAKVKAAVDAVVDATGVRRYVSPSGNAEWENDLVTEAHGMGVQPFFLAAYVVCVTADGGWSPGDRIWLGQYENGGLGGHAASDATNLYWRGGTSQRFFQKGSSANFDPFESRWELYFFALF